MAELPNGRPAGAGVFPAGSAAGVGTGSGAASCGVPELGTVPAFCTTGPRLITDG